jgi:hypothetical protein
MLQTHTFKLGYRGQRRLVPEKGAGVETALIQVCPPVAEPEGETASMVDLQPHADPDGLARLVGGHRSKEVCQVGGGRHFLVGVSAHTWKSRMKEHSGSVARTYMNVLQHAAAVLYCTKCI